MLKNTRLYSLILYYLFAYANQTFCFPNSTRKVFGLRRISGYIMAKYISRLSLVFIIACISSTLGSRVHPIKQNGLEQVQNRDAFQNLPFRLPRSVIPKRYKLEMAPILDEIPQHTRFTAIGKVRIEVECTEVTSVIKLHAADLTIDEGSVQVTNSLGQPHPITSFEYQIEFEFFIINLGSSLIAGETYEIFIPFTALVSQNRLDGMYLDSYVNPENNVTRYVATTLFAANTARRAFPCFDEPDLKAQFEISLARAIDYHALSNMHLINTESFPDLPGWVLDNFAPSPNMSTYLVCMIVSDLTYEEASTSDPEGPIHRVYAPFYFIERGGGKYSANLSMTVLSAFETYYNMSYPLMKLDNVALPQFYYNAMENWGLMTYADRVLIYFEGETSQAQRYQLSLTVSHEVSHNFFGNIVTCQWWTYVWLNEGWATFASHLGLEMTYPELRPWEQFIPEIYQVAMEYDSSLGTHPVANEPLSPQDIGAIYDEIAYEKGASLIRMMEEFLTEPVLQIGVQRYLQKWQYGITHQDDLFESLQEVVDEIGSGSLLPSGTTVKDIMDTWTTQAGFPVIKVSRISNSEVIISQEQFVLNGATTGNETWWIPIRIQILTGSNAGTLALWMSKDEKNRTITLLESDLFLVNPTSIGYYRVLYSKELFKEMIEVLENKHESLEPSSRVKLLDDSFALALMDKIPIELALQLTSYIHKETDYFVWKTLRKHLGKIAIQFEGTQYKNAFLNYILPKVQSVSKNPTLLQDTSPISIMLRDELSHWICDLDHTQCNSKHFMGTYSQTNSLKSQGLSETEISKLLADCRDQSEVDEIISRMGSEGNTRQIIFDTIEKIIPNLESHQERNWVHMTMTKLCHYSNSEEDISKLMQITSYLSSNNRSSTTRHLKRLQNCIIKAETVVNQMNKYGSRVNSWIKNNHNNV